MAIGSRACEIVVGLFFSAAKNDARVFEKYAAQSYCGRRPVICEAVGGLKHDQKHHQTGRVVADSPRDWCGTVASSSGGLAS
jgi:hypothetical protein